MRRSEAVKGLNKGGQWSQARGGIIKCRGQGAPRKASTAEEG